jgi:hypothetical protein
VINPPPDPFTEKERDEILAYFEAKYFHNNKGGWPQGFVFLYVQLGGHEAERDRGAEMDRLRP